MALAFLRNYPGLGQVSVCLASTDAELGAYLTAMGAQASMSTDENGEVCIQINDNPGGDVVWSSFLEEIVHAFQNAKTGVIALSCDSAERNEREHEAAACLLANADQLRLSERDKKHYQDAVGHYGGGSYA